MLLKVNIFIDIHVKTRLHEKTLLTSSYFYFSPTDNHINKYFSVIKNIGRFEIDRLAFNRIYS